MRNGDPIALNAVFTQRSGEHLYETALSKNQRLLELEGGRLELTATERMGELRHYLSGQLI